MFDCAKDEHSCQEGVCVREAGAVDPACKKINCDKPYHDCKTAG